MNKTDVIMKVSERSGIPADVCDRVIASLEKVLQDELGSKGGRGVLGAIAGLVCALTSGKKA